MRCLVTAGNTREKIDDVREWGNVFTGGTGFAIAKALAAVADEVDLVTSTQAHVADVRAQGPGNVHATGFRTHAELREALASLMGGRTYDAIVMTAAVSDYRPSGAYSVVQRRPHPQAPHMEVWMVQNVQAAKVKSEYPEVAFLGEKTEKLVDLFRRDWNHKGLLVKFKLEVGIEKDELIRVGEASRVISGADYLVANTLAMVNGKDAGAYLLSQHEPEWVPRAQLAGRTVRLVTESRR